MERECDTTTCTVCMDGHTPSPLSSESGRSEMHHLSEEARDLQVCLTSLPVLLQHLAEPDRQERHCGDQVHLPVQWKMGWTLAGRQLLRLGPDVQIYNWCV